MGEHDGCRVKGSVPNLEKEHSYNDSNSKNVRVSESGSIGRDSEGHTVETRTRRTEKENGEKDT